MHPESMFPYTCARARKGGDGYANSFKRGRYSDPGRGPAREPESTEKRLENFITRVGEKVSCCVLSLLL